MPRARVRPDHLRARPPIYSGETDQEAGSGADEAKAEPGAEQHREQEGHRLPRREHAVGRNNGLPLWLYVQPKWKTAYET